MTLADILKTAKPGSTVAPEGLFVAERIEDLAFDPPVTLNLAKATIRGFRFDRIKGLRIKGGTFENIGVTTHYSDGALVYGYCLFLFECEDITFNRVSFEGPNATPDGYGIQTSHCRQIHVTDCAFRDFKMGLLFGQTDGFSAVNCDFRGALADGINIGNAWNGVIEYCSFREGRVGPGHHPDAIQLFSRPNYKPTANILIRRNNVNMNSQGICGFNHVRLQKKGYKLWTGEVLTEDRQVDDGGFENITVEDNFVFVDAPQAINISSCRNPVIRNNIIRTLALAPKRASLNGGDNTNMDRRGNMVGPGGGNLAIIDPDFRVVGEDSARVAELEATLEAMAKAKARETADKLAAQADLAAAQTMLTNVRAAVAP